MLLNKNELKAKGWLKISDLARKSGVSVSTIHYYIQQGLLVEPARTSRNMAYYDPACIEEIKNVQDLQSTRFLPLSSIRLLLKARREGQGEQHLGEMRSFFEDIFRPVGDKRAQELLSRADLIKETGADAGSLNTLEEQGLIVPGTGEQGRVYDDVDLSLLRTYQKLAGLGLTPQDLNLYKKYVEFTVEEARELHALFHRRPDHEGVSIIEFFRTVREFKDYLAIRVYRREAQQLHGATLRAGRNDNSSIES